MKAIGVLDLSFFIINKLPKNRHPLTHLKLQKLLFYCYGIAAARGYDCFDSSFQFEAWEHGPVSRVAYEHYKNFGKNELQESSPCQEFSPDFAKTLLQVLYIYGSLSPWEIREQTHREKPWRDVYCRNAREIENGDIISYFKEKYFSQKKEVFGPEYPFDLSSFKLDHIPIVGYRDFDELAESARRIFFSERPGQLFADR